MSNTIHIVKQYLISLLSPEDKIKYLRNKLTKQMNLPNYSLLSEDLKKEIDYRIQLEYEPTDIKEVVKKYSEGR